MRPNKVETVAVRRLSIYKNNIRIQNFLVRHSPRIPKFLHRKTLQFVPNRETTHQQVQDLLNLRDELLSKCRHKNNSN